MKIQSISFTLAFVCFLHYVYAEDCNPDKCKYLKCMQVENCPAGSYKQTFGYCNCCSSCVKYSVENESCENTKCLPELKCNNKTKICESTNKPNLCDRVRCADNPICGDGPVLPRNPKLCRCCAVCALEGETENDSRCEKQAN